MSKMLKRFVVVFLAFSFFLIPCNIWLLQLKHYMVLNKYINVNEEKDSNSLYKNYLKKKINSCQVDGFGLNICFESRLLKQKHCKKNWTFFQIKKSCDKGNAMYICKNADLSSRVSNLKHNVTVFIYNKTRMLNKKLCESKKLKGEWVVLNNVKNKKKYPTKFIP